jgi:hypothetical protein
MTKERILPLCYICIWYTQIGTNVAERAEERGELMLLVLRVGRMLDIRDDHTRICLLLPVRRL